MRLAFLTFSTVPFGSNDLLYYRTAHLALRQGHAVLVSPYDWGFQNASEYDDIARRGATVSYRRAYRRHPNIFARQWQKLSYKWYNPLTNFSFLTAWSPDIVVVSDAGTYHFMSAPGCADTLLSLKIPFITISQFNDEISSPRPEVFQKAQRLFNEAVACVFVSQRNLNAARRQLCLNLPQATVLDNPPNLTSFAAEPFPESPSIRMAMVARLECAVKGQAVVLEILAQPEWRERKWTLNMYGRGPDEGYLLELISFYGLEDRVQLYGYCNDVRQLWQRDMILLMCSTGEGKPLALIEAMVCGRPAVVTDVGGNAELIQEGDNGFVAESATVSSFRSAMERAWHARDRWSSMGLRGHAIITERLSPMPEEKLLQLILHVARGKDAKCEAVATRRDNPFTSRLSRIDSG